MTKNYKVVFAGSGPYAEPIFAALVKSFNNLTLVTKKNEPLGQSIKTTKPTVKALGSSKNIPTFEINNKSELLDVVKKIKPDLVVVSSLGMIITEETLKIPKYGFINIHYSLLPAYRGPSPVQFAILNGDKETGFVIQKISNGVDEGDILYQSDAVTLNDDETTVTLRDKLLDLAAQKIETVVYDYIQDKITLKPQVHTKATYSKIITKSDGKIDWGEPAKIISRKIRAYTPWPGTYTQWTGKVLKILEATISDNESEQEIGTFYEIGQKKYGVQTGKGTLLIEKLQLEGKKPLETSDFLLGNSQMIGAVLG